jgi:hypothetical protein
MVCLDDDAKGHLVESDGEWRLMTPLRGILADACNNDADADAATTLLAKPCYCGNPTSTTTSLILWRVTKRRRR